EEASGSAFAFLDALGHFLDVGGNLIEIGDGGLRSIDDVADALLGQAVDPIAALDGLTAEGARNNVNHIITEHARAFEHGERIGANALTRRTAIELAVKFHDDFHIVLRLRIGRNFLEFDLFDAADL